jgi:hypothetical protein
MTAAGEGILTTTTDVDRDIQIRIGSDADMSFEIIWFSNVHSGEKNGNFETFFSWSDRSE